MGDIRSSYLIAADSAVALLREPAVAARWEEPSALAEFGVAGLSGHFVGQIIRTHEVLRLDVPPQKPISLMGHYARAPWVRTGIDHESNVVLRQVGEQAAAGGVVALADQVEEMLEEQRRTLLDEPADRVVPLPWVGWSLLLDDYLLTRTLELVIHADDLAVSVGVATPELPSEVTEPVIDLLARLAVHRHGPTAVIRALSRAERAPATVSAF